MRSALRDRPIAIIDTETTGFKVGVHEIIEIAIMKIQGNERDMWTAKIKPERIETASSKALEINGYDPELWQDAIPMRDAANTIRKRLAGCVLIGHNLEFDLGFIVDALRANGGRGLGFHYKIDTMALAYEHLAGLGLNSLSLENVCNYLGISNEGAHGAEVDVLRTYDVYSRLSRSSFFHRLFWRLRAES